MTHLKPPSPQFRKRTTHLTLKSLASPYKVQSLNPSPTDKENIARNSQARLEKSSDFHYLSPAMTKPDKIKTPEQKSLNELEFDGSFNSEEDSKQQAPKISTHNHIKTQSRSSLGTFPKTMSALEPAVRARKNSWYWDFSQPQRYNFYWYKPELKDEDIRPKGREGATLTVIGEKAYLYGGLSTGIMKELHVYNLNKNKWKIPGVVGEVPRQGRSGHSAVGIKSSLWIFGGETEAPSNATYRVCLNNMIVYNTALGQWNTVQARSIKEPIAPRRNHAACVYDQIMVVYGGVGQLGDYLNDVWVFNTGFKKFSLVVVINNVPA